MFKKIIISIISGLLITNASFAGMKDDLNKFFSAQGYDANVSSGTAFRDQSGGYYTGGSLIARHPVENYNMLSLQNPSMKLGCGSIDLHSGGFSFIDAEAFLKLVNDIGSKAMGMGISIALQTVSPQIKSAIDQLMSMAQEVNNMNINSCNAAASLVGSVWPRTEASNRALCQDIGLANGKFSDFAAARQGCGVEGKHTEVNGQKNSTPGFKDQLGTQYNLTWQALKKNNFFANDNNLAELFMSLSGTIIRKMEGSGINATPKPRYLEALITKQETLKAIVEGGKLTIYRCDLYEADQCLNPTTKEIEIKLGNSLLYRVDELVRSIATKLTDESKEVTSQEIGLVNSTKIPILKIIAIQSAFTQDNAPIVATELSEIIAYDLLFSYLERIIDVVTDSLQNLRSVQMNEQDLKTFINGLRQSKQLIYQKRQGLYQYLNTTLAVIERSGLIEKQLNGVFFSTVE